MFRALPVCALLLLCGLVAAAPPVPTETVIKLTVQPAAAPVPSLKYQLLPELAEMNPGNPIQGYLRCFSEQNQFFYGKGAWENREKWSKMPLNELPMKDLLDYGHGALRRADQAARLDKPDWQVLLQLKAVGPSLALPDLQQMRTLANALRIRFRAEIAAGHFDDAVATAKTMFALSRHCGEHPTLIGTLVGIAISMQAIQPVDEMIGQPGSPNLYWALANLPEPLIDCRHGIQGERLVVANELNAMIDPNAPLTAETRSFARDIHGSPRTLTDENVRLDTEEARFDRVIGRIWLLNLLANVSNTKDGQKTEEEIRKWIREHEQNKEYMAAARRHLAEANIATAGRKTWQIVLMNEKLRIETQNDEVIRTIPLPYWQAEPMLAGIKATKSEIFGALILPGKVRVAQVRLLQRLALIRTVEAVRLYAAAHDGKAPAQLVDVGVPIPVDPVTGKPFIYETKESSFIVRGTPPKGMEKHAPMNVRYEVTIRK